MNEQVTEQRERPHMISEAALIAEIRRSAAASPGPIYDKAGVGPSCTYLPGGNNPCGCLVGAALAALGVPKPVLANLDSGALGQPAGWGTENAAHILAAHVARTAVFSQWICAVQVEQDRGLAWEAAVRRADIQYGGPALA